MMQAFGASSGWVRAGKQNLELQMCPRSVWDSSQALPIFSLQHQASKLVGCIELGKVFFVEKKEGS